MHCIVLHLSWEIGSDTYRLLPCVASLNYRKYSAGSILPVRRSICQIAANTMGSLSHSTSCHCSCPGRAVARSGHSPSQVLATRAMHSVRGMTRRRRHSSVTYAGYSEVPTLAAGPRQGIKNDATELVGSTPMVRSSWHSLYSIDCFQGENLSQLYHLRVCMDRNTVLCLEDIISTAWYKGY